MYPENNTCAFQCHNLGKQGGKLVIDGDVCPFQYFCQCACDSCEKKCVSEGKIHVKEKIDKYGCSFCNCQCSKKTNCWKICKGDNFFLENNTMGCLECKCTCPNVNCDANCTGKDVIRKDKTGCPVCNGCKSGAIGGKLKKIDYHVHFVKNYLYAFAQNCKY